MQPRLARVESQASWLEQMKSANKGLAETMARAMRPSPGFGLSPGSGPGPGTAAVEAGNEVVDLTIDSPPSSEASEAGGDNDDEREVAETCVGEKD